MSNWTGEYCSGTVVVDDMEDALDVPLRDIIPIMQEGIIHKTSYWGVSALKSPMDAWVYQELIFETKPDVIIEVGNARGGGALYLAHLCDLMGKGRVICLDISHKAIHKKVRQHPRITFIEGDACDNITQVRKLVGKSDAVLVIEDSDHTYENTLNVLRTFSQFTKPGDYFIVEDSNCHHGLESGPNPGPYEAIETFISENSDFEIDRTREHFFITWNPKGYLRRKGVPNRSNEVLTPTPEANWQKRSRLEDFVRLFVPPILLTIRRKLIAWIR